MGKCKQCNFGTENETGLCDKCMEKQGDKPRKPRDDREIVIRQIFSHKGQTWLFEVGWDIQENGDRPVLTLQRPIRLTRRC